MAPWVAYVCEIAPLPRPQMARKSTGIWMHCVPRELGLTSPAANFALPRACNCANFWATTFDGRADGRRVQQRGDYLSHLTVVAVQKIGNTGKTQLWRQVQQEHNLTRCWPLSQLSLAHTQSVCQLRPHSLPRQNLFCRLGDIPSQVTLFCRYRSRTEAEVGPDLSGDWEAAVTHTA